MFQSSNLVFTVIFTKELNSLHNFDDLNNISVSTESSDSLFSMGFIRDEIPEENIDILFCLAFQDALNDGFSLNDIISTMEFDLSSSFNKLDVLKEELVNSGNNFDLEWKEALIKLLKEYKDVFPDELPAVLPPLRSVNHKIPLINENELIRPKVYPIHSSVIIAPTGTTLRKGNTASFQKKKPENIASYNLVPIATPPQK